MTARKRKKKTDAQYKAMAKKIAPFTVVNYSRKKLTPALKSQITKAANLLARGTFAPLAKKKSETQKQYSARVKKVQKAQGLKVTGTIRGGIVSLHDKAEKVKLTNEGLEYSVKGFKGKEIKFKRRNGYRVRQEIESIEENGLSDAAQRGIRNEVMSVVKGKRFPYILTARSGGSRVMRSAREILNKQELEDFIEEVIGAVERYAASGVLTIEFRK